MKKLKTVLIIFAVACTLVIISNTNDNVIAGGGGRTECIGAMNCEYGPNYPLDTNDWECAQPTNNGCMV